VAAPGVPELDPLLCRQGAPVGRDHVAFTPAGWSLAPVGASRW
jgi:hypothetical protein